MDELPTDSDLIIVPLSVDVGLLPEWYEAIRAVAIPLCTRIGTIEQPERWLVQVQLPRDRVDAFKQGLVEAWEAFVAKRKAEGRWQA